MVDLALCCRVLCVVKCSCPLESELRRRTCLGALTDDVSCTSESFFSSTLTVFCFLMSIEQFRLDLQIREEKHFNPQPCPRFDIFYLQQPLRQPSRKVESFSNFGAHDCPSYFRDSHKSLCCAVSMREHCCLDTSAMHCSRDRLGM